MGFLESGLYVFGFVWYGIRLYLFDFKHHHYMTCPIPLPPSILSPFFSPLFNPTQIRIKIYFSTPTLDFLNLRSGFRGKENS